MVLIVLYMSIKINGNSDYLLSTSKFMSLSILTQGCQFGVCHTKIDKLVFSKTFTLHFGTTRNSLSKRKWCLSENGGIFYPGKLATPLLKSRIFGRVTSLVLSIPNFAKFCIFWRRCIQNFRFEIKIYLASWLHVYPLCLPEFSEPEIPTRLSFFCKKSVKK